MKHHKYHQNCWSDSKSTSPKDWDGILIVAGCIAMLTVLGVVMACRS